MQLSFDYNIAKSHVFTVLKTNARSKHTTHRMVSERLEHLGLEVLAELQEQEAPGVREGLSVQEEQRAQVAL